VSEKLCIDLCSGLGGLSQAFVAVGWEVITVDIEPKFNPTFCADITKINGMDIMMHSKRGPRHYSEVIVVASPPCTAFSVASIPRHWKGGIPDSEVVKGLEIFTACIRIISEIKPRRWLIENPRGMLRALIGKPKTSINLSDFGTPYKKPTDLWGNIMLPMIKERKQWQKAPRGSRQGLMAATIRNPAQRSLMPLGLSLAILQSIEENPR
jgi:site-specific DNA-cytosine methylase